MIERSEPETTQKHTSSAAGVEDAASIEPVDQVSPHDERVAQLLQHTIDVPVLAEAVERQEAADAADTLETLPEEDAAEILVQMDDQAAASALSEMQMPLAISVIEDLLEDEPAYAGRLVQIMAPDDAADLIQSLDDDERVQLLGAMESEPAGELIELASYDEETAGGLMTTNFIALRDSMTVDQATEFIRSIETTAEYNNALVTDENDRLVGIVSLRKLLLAKGRERITDLMTMSVRVIPPELDRETVAHEFDRYDYEMLPVVGEDQHLLGIVTVDDVIDIIRSEQTEDVQRTVGAGAGEAVYSNIREKIKGRFPWLLVSLLMTCIAAAVVLVFEELIQQWTILAFLMPVMAALVGNAGHQALAVTLRGIVLEEVRKGLVWPLVIREGLVGLFSGLALGTALLALLLIFQLFSDSTIWQIGVIAACSMTISMAVGTLAGTCVPLVMRRFGADPAHASAIFLIMITDAISFSSLLLLTSFASHWLLTGA